MGMNDPPKQISNVDWALKGRVSTSKPEGKKYLYDQDSFRTREVAKSWRTPHNFLHSDSFIFAETANRFCSANHLVISSRLFFFNFLVDLYFDLLATQIITSMLSVVISLYLIRNRGKMSLVFGNTPYKNTLK